MKTIVKILVFTFCLWGTQAFAELSIKTKNFVNSGTLEAPDKITLQVSETLDNTKGMIKAPIVVIDAPNLAGISDTKVGKICFTNSFKLNGIDVPKSYSKCK